jgi:hypothetical protein
MLEERGKERGVLLGKLENKVEAPTKAFEGT